MASRRILVVPRGAGRYARPLEAFTIAAAPKGGWCWFGDPRAYYHDGKTVMGWLDGSTGLPMAAAWDHASRTLSTPVSLYTLSTFETDDHDNPAFLRRASDGKILAAYTLHVGAAYTALSTNADDATAFGSITNVTSQFGSLSGGAGYTYAHLAQLLDETNDPIYYTYRYHDTGGTAHLAFSKSTDGGATWTARTAVCVVTYHKLAKNGEDRIDFILSNHPDDAGNHDIRHMYLQGGNWYKSDGTQITASQPFAITEATRIYDGSTTMGWLWDIAIDPATGYPVVAFATFPGATNPGGPATDHRAYYGRWTGSAWDVHEIVPMGGKIPTADQPGGNPQSFYSGGVVLDQSDPSIAYVSVEVSAGRWDIYRYKTTDGGATWSSYALTSSGKNVRPVSVLNHARDLQVLWLTGTYTNYVTYSQGTAGAGV